MATHLILIDGHNQVYRAYYAPSAPLRSPDGEPTKATYLFTKMLVKLVREREPTHLAVAMDGSRKTLRRRKVFPDYKASREARTLDPDLPVQIKRVRQVLEALDVPVLRSRLDEADDIIATLCERYQHKVDRVTVVSRDSDLHALVSPRCSILDPMSGTILDESGVVEKHGVLPSQMEEYKVLTGDSSDCIPGVRGIGPAKAAKLLNHYGTLDTVLECQHELTPAVRKALGEADLAMGRRLVGLKRDVPTGVTLSDLRYDGLDFAYARPLFRQLGFKRFDL